MEWPSKAGRDRIGSRKQGPAGMSRIPLRSIAKESVQCIGESRSWVGRISIAADHEDSLLADLKFGRKDHHGYSFHITHLIDASTWLTLTATAFESGRVRFPECRRSRAILKFAAHQKDLGDGATAGVRVQAGSSTSISRNSDVGDRSMLRTSQ